MKISSVIFILLFSTLMSVKAQDKCQVLLNGIDSSYTGGCRKGLADGQGEAWGTDHYTGTFKKGLPHGNGTYEYSDGSVYKGMWMMGQKHGEGQMTFKFHGKDTVQIGAWENDKFVGKKSNDPGYKIIMSQSLERVRIYKQAEGEEVHVIFKPVSAGALDLTNLQMSSSSGVETELLNSEVEYSRCLFPFSIRISFNKWNKFQTMRVDVRFEAEIRVPGLWIIELGV